LNKKKLKDFVNGKSFYVTLAVCFGVIIVCAGIITMQNTKNITKDNEYAQKDEDYTEQAKPVLVNEELPSIDIDEEESIEMGAGISENISSYEQEVTTANIIETQESESTTTSTEEIIEQQTQVQTQAQTQEETTKEENIEQNIQTVSESNEAEVKEIFLSFNDEENKMQWPVQGQIVMDYSKDHTIYDKTLEQYRVNESISIAAQVGTAVKASAAGTVLSITNDAKKGCSIVLDHGNGWQTTYSQLEQNVPVAQNEVVEAGDVIGGVANPTIYSTALGSHLDFAVSKNGQSVDPKIVLED